MSNDTQTLPPISEIHSLAQTGPEYDLPSPMSIEQLCDVSNMKDSDIERMSQEMEAVQALGTMRALGDGAQDGELETLNQPFISRVSNIPLVNSALRFYEQSKTNSKIVKYGAERVESAVKTIGMPVLNKLEPQLGQLDEFACRQLDSLEKRYPSLKRQDGEEVMAHETSGLRQRNVSSAKETDITSDPPSQSQSLTQVSTASVQRSRWEQYLVEASAAAGAGAAAFSEESMRALKYCLQWLQYATGNIDQQISLLKEYIAGLNGNSSESTALTVHNPSTLASIKRELIETVRKVVDVVGRYAGSCLPGEARKHVREFILTLPGRLATVHSASPSPMGSPLMSPASDGPRNNLPGSAQRVLVFATESLLMLNSIAGIFKDSVDRAENWAEKLKVFGVSNGATGGNPAQRDLSGQATAFSIRPAPYEQLSAEPMEE
ncbi:Opi1-domain-containing protein [Basidiobolus meristosporus CBS 931.73]|uniref:Opi1-domain-containing protein n=1 Tax=Basidiobolus meristosporus CBS 931.73 TaxID=1314790 RepID=A0A1Y1YB52_9FUNG|nr:Opi1-domain-containing protein [Basidiobolus meristosporus CBS 931.73]|eukprot:ORX94844.1 Opi1-domain-containing protein [Basidiobolus meristosporus CBS 931.73]